MSIETIALSFVAAFVVFVIVCGLIDVVEAFIRMKRGNRK